MRSGLRSSTRCRDNCCSALMCSRTLGACFGLSSQSRSTDNLSPVRLAGDGKLLAGVDVEIQPQYAADVPEQPLARDRERPAGEGRGERVEVLAVDLDARKRAEQPLHVPAGDEIGVRCGLAGAVRV